MTSASTPRKLTPGWQTHLRKSTNSFQRVIFTSFGTLTLLLCFSFLSSLKAQEITTSSCPLKKLNGIAAQEMMVKGVIMQTELEKQENDAYAKYTFIHTVRADWTIWICIQGVEVKNDQPDKLTLACTACDY